MNELQDPNAPKKRLLTRPGAKPSEVQSLDTLLSALNNPDIHQDVEPGVKSDPTASFQAIPPGNEAPPAITVPIRQPVSQPGDLGLGPVGSNGAIGTNGVDGAPRPRTPLDQEGPIGPNGGLGTAGTQAPDNQRLYFTGRLCAGKDFAAAAAGCQIFGFADPLYSIAAHFFNREFSSTAGKELVGARAFLQAVGQIGRGVISELYPLTIARALLEDAIRAKGVYGELGTGVEWASFGSNNNIWLNAAIARVESFLSTDPGARVALTNVRFDFERAALKEAGWSGWHCMCSPQTWSARLLKSKLTPQSPQVADISEKLAAALDAGVIKELSARKNGSKLRVIWTDDLVACPSNRLHTVDSFLQLLNVAPVPAAITPDDNF